MPFFQHGLIIVASSAEQLVLRAFTARAHGLVQPSDRYPVGQGGSSRDVLVIEGQVDQFCAFSDMPGVVAAVEVWPELAFEFGEGLFTVGSLGVNQGGAA